jgi:hypothetical protein
LGTANFADGGATQGVVSGCDHGFDLQAAFIKTMATIAESLSADEHI